MHFAYGKERNPMDPVDPVDLNRQVLRVQ
jgi:hypothetical protein